MSTATVTVQKSRQAKGDCGPCAHVDCDERATNVIEIVVDGLVAQTWACPQHASEVER